MQVMDTDWYYQCVERVVGIIDTACKEHDLVVKGTLTFCNRLGKPITEKTWKYHKAKEAPSSLTLQQRTTIQSQMKEINCLAKECCSWDCLVNV